MANEEMYSEAWRDLNAEFGKVIAQRDALADALRNLADACGHDTYADIELKAAADALKALEIESDK